MDEILKMLVGGGIAALCSTIIAAKVLKAEVENNKHNLERINESITARDHEIKEDQKAIRGEIGKILKDQVNFQRDMQRDFVSMHTFNEHTSKGGKS